MYQKILVAVDEREMAMRALAEARDLAAAFQGELVLLHVTSSAPKSAQHKRLGIVAETPEGESINLVNNVLEVMAGSPVKYKLHSAVGDAATQILKLAEDQKCDAIVMGSRGLGSITKFFIGSVSSEVMNKAEVPVLIVK